MSAQLEVMRGNPRRHKTSVFRNRQEASFPEVHHPITRRTVPPSTATECSRQLCLDTVNGGQVSVGLSLERHSRQKNGDEK